MLVGVPDGLRLYLTNEEMATNGNEDVIVRRNRPGTKAEDLCNWPFQEYTDMDSTLDGKIANFYTLGGRLG